MLSEQVKANKMAVMAMPKLLFSMSLPLMISLLVQSLYNIVDGIYVARISETALTATSLAYPMQILIVAVSVGTGVGVNALISQKLGAKDYQKANQVATIGLFLAVLSSLVFVFCGFFLTKRFVSFFTSDPITGLLSEQYLRICLIFCLGIFVDTMAQRVLQSTGNTFFSMISLVVGAVTNIVLDPIFIIGWLGFPAMGIQGAAIATVVGQWLGAVVALVLHHFYNREIRYQFQQFHMDRETVLAIYRVGAPTIVMQAMGSIMVSGMNAILISLSATAVAFFGVYFKLQNFLFMPMNGLGQALIPIVGYNYGAKNGQRVKAALKVAVPAAVSIALAGTVIFFLFPKALLGLFSASAEMLAIGVPALRLISVTFVFGSLTLVLGYAASGLGNGLMNMIGAALRQLIVLLPLAYLLSRLAGIHQIWFAMWSAEAIAALYAVLGMRRELKQKIDPLEIK